MDGQLNNNEFVEILKYNSFNEKFNIPKEQKIDNIAYATLDFIRKNVDIEGSPLQPLSILLKAYGISVGAYFSFLETIKDINFDDKEYKSFLTNEYKNLFREIDNSNIDDLDKLIYKMQMLELAEKSRIISEKNNMKGKVILYTAGTVLGVGVGATASYVGVKYMNHVENMAKIASKTSTIKTVCENVKDIAVSAINVAGKILD